MEPTLAITKNRYVYFRSRSRKICPSCMRRLPEKQAFSLCEFLIQKAQWQDLVIFCKDCYEKVALPRVLRDTRTASDRVVYVDIKGKNLPHWLTYRK